MIYNLKNNNMWIKVPEPMQTEVTTSWVYRNRSLWLISMKYYSEWFTMSDKNLWATQVYNDWDEKTDSNCWKLFQRWNNNPFPWISTSDINWIITISDTKVDTTWYWPWNYYNSNIWINGGTSSWQSSVNSNLWWWSESYDDYTKRQWPCPNWWHIPSQHELGIFEDMTRLGFYNSSIYMDFVQKVLKIPYANYRLYGWAMITSTVKQARIRSSDNWHCTFSNNGANRWFKTVANSTWEPIRPFKNEPVIPTIYWEVLYQF